MKTLRQWTQELMAQQFLDGLIVGFLMGALIVTGVAVAWLQDKSIVRAHARLDPVSPDQSPAIDDPGTQTLLMSGPTQGRVAVTCSGRMRVDGHPRLRPEVEPAMFTFVDSARVPTSALLTP